MRRSLCVIVVVMLAGCSDRLGQGARVVLVAPGAESVEMVGMERHASGDHVKRSFDNFMGRGPQATDERIGVGTRAVVLSDAGGAGDRAVRIRLIDGPFSELTGDVPRANVRPE